MAEGPVVIALGGNALKGDHCRLDYPELIPACIAMAGAADGGLVVIHGNGPQIGRLQLSDPDNPKSLDILGAETEGLLGYRIEQALANALAPRQFTATLLTCTEVKADDEAFQSPSKPIGLYLSADEAEQLGEKFNWEFRQYSKGYRRLVPSPQPVAVLQKAAIESLLGSGIAVICAGGGGIPVVRLNNHYCGVDAVVDKDLVSALLARELQARLLVLATDVDGVYRHWSGDESTSRGKLERTTPQELSLLSFADGTIQPKVRAACEFVNNTGQMAVIGALEELASLLQGNTGTRIASAWE